MVFARERMGRMSLHHQWAPAMQLWYHWRISAFLCDTSSIIPVKHPPKTSRLHQNSSAGIVLSPPSPKSPGKRPSTFVRPLTSGSIILLVLIIPSRGTFTRGSSMVSTRTKWLGERTLLGGGECGGMMLWSGIWSGSRQLILTRRM